MSYAVYKLQQAVAEMSAPGTMRSRLLNAYIVHLMRLAPADLPPAVRADFADFKRRMARVKLGMEVDNPQQVTPLNDTEIRHMVDKLYELHATVAEKPEAVPA